MPAVPDAGLLAILLAVFAPVVCGASTLLLPRRGVTSRVLLTLAGFVAATALLAWHGVAYPPGEATAVGVPFVPSLHVDLVFLADRLGLFFGLLVSGIGCLIVLYARGYFGPDHTALRRFYPMLGFFATAMLGIVLSDSMLGMFLFWELTTISSFLLIGWEREDRRAVRLAVQAFVVTGLGGLALLGGLILLGTATGVWTFSALPGALGSAGTNAALLPWAFGLIFVGGAAKSAQWPLHFWLPGAMAAPTPVSAYLHSATMVKAGVYLFGRLFPALGAGAFIELWPPTLVSIGAVTMLIGAVLALRSQGLKKIFAYTTVSQLGLLVCAYGLGSFSDRTADGAVVANLAWPVTQILNHALYKAPLFIIAGAIIHITHRNKLNELRGLLRMHPVLAVTCIAGCYALAGMPLTLSFSAKEAFLHQIDVAARIDPVVWAVGVMAVIAAACNVAIFARFTAIMISRPAAETDGSHGHEGAHEHDRWASCLWWPAAFIIAWQYLLGLGLIADDLGMRIASVVLDPLETNRGGWAHLPGLVYALSKPSMPLAMSVVAIAMGLVVGVTPLLRRPVTDPHDRLFPSCYRGIQRGGFAVFSRVQSGNMRRYVVIALSALVLSLVVLALRHRTELLEVPRTAVFFTSQINLGFRLVSVFLAILICGSALLMPMVRSRITRVLLLGTCGFSVTGMYLLYQAPDLALTQLMFEIISVILFLLVLRLLPEEPGQVADPSVLRGMFAVVVGLSIGWVVLHAGAHADDANLAALASAEREAAGGGEAPFVLASAPADGPSEPHPYAGAPVTEARLGPWFLEHAYKGSPATDGRNGGGKNTVNVILVDFRGYDTLGEITVLGIAMMGVLAMLSAIPARGAGMLMLPGAADGLRAGPQGHLRSVLFHTAMRLILPLSFIFASYVFFKGHNAPGGGFIAGLVAAVALAVYRMSDGVGALKRLMPVKPGKLAAAGLAIALATGVAPLLLGLLPIGLRPPFLTSDHWYIPLPGGGEYHLTTVLFFDLGVFLVVVAVSVGMINRFEEELE